MALGRPSVFLNAIRGTVGGATFRLEQGRQQIYTDATRRGDSRCGTDKAKDMLRHVNRMWRCMPPEFHHWCWELGKREGIAGYNLFVRDNMRSLMGSRPLNVPICPTRSYLPRLNIRKIKFNAGINPSLDVSFDPVVHPYVTHVLAFAYHTPFQSEVLSGSLGGDVRCFVNPGTGDPDAQEALNEWREEHPIGIIGTPVPTPLTESHLPWGDLAGPGAIVLLFTCAYIFGIPELGLGALALMKLGPMAFLGLALGL